MRFGGLTSTVVASGPLKVGKMGDHSSRTYFFSANNAA